MNQKKARQVAYILFNLAILLGFVCPLLISSTHDELVTIGVLLLIADLWHLVTFVNNQLVNPKQKEDEEDL